MPGGLRRVCVIYCTTDWDRLGLDSKLAQASIGEIDRVFRQKNAIKIGKRVVKSQSGA